MNEIEKIKQLKKDIIILEKRANDLVEPLVLKRKKQLDALNKWYNNEYSKIESKVNNMIEKQNEIEMEIERIENSLPTCTWCGKSVLEHDKEAVKLGFLYCTECFNDLDICETCGSLGQYGVNTEENNIDTCWECDITYCDNCGHECPEEEEEE